MPGIGFTILWNKGGQQPADGERRSPLTPKGSPPGDAQHWPFPPAAPAEGNNTACMAPEAFHHEPWLKTYWFKMHFF